MKISWEKTYSLSGSVGRVIYFECALLTTIVGECVFVILKAGKDTFVKSEKCIFARGGMSW